MSAQRCDVAELAGLFLFEGLDAAQLERLAGAGTCRTEAAGPVCRAGEPAEWLFVLLEGELALSIGAADDEAPEVEIARSSTPGSYGGAIRAYLDDPRGQVYPHSLRAVTSSRIFLLPAGEFAAMVREWFPMAVHLLRGQLLGTERQHDAMARREHLLALGSLAAGLTHELNNPAAAAARATGALRNRVWRTREKLAALAQGDHSREELATLLRLQDLAVQHAAGSPELSPIQAADAQEELVRWFEAYDIEDGWDLAPSFVQAGLGLQFLNRVELGTSPALLPEAVRWLNYTVETELLMQEIEDSTARISTLVAAASQYSRLDTASPQIIDVHGQLEATLLMFSHRLQRIKVVKRYAESLPPVRGYAEELNQVWTNLIDNAIGALAVGPAEKVGATLTVTTRTEADQVVVGIGDTGPGIPDEVRARIFDPFFTTKPFGQGTGLGLDVASRIVVQRHHGDLRVHSSPGGTEFVVYLPSAATGAPASGGGA